MTCRHRTEDDSGGAMIPDVSPVRHADEVDEAKQSNIYRSSLPVSFRPDV